MERKKRCINHRGLITSTTYSDNALPAPAIADDGHALYHDSRYFLSRCRHSTLAAMSRRPTPICRQLRDSRWPSHEEEEEEEYRRRRFGRAGDRDCRRRQAEERMSCAQARRTRRTNHGLQQYRAQGKTSAKRSHRSHSRQEAATTRQETGH